MQYGTFLTVMKTESPWVGSSWDLKVVCPSWIRGLDIWKWGSLGWQLMIVQAYQSSHKTLYQKNGWFSKSKAIQFTATINKSYSVVSQHYFPKYMKMDLFFKMCFFQPKVRRNKMLKDTAKINKLESKKYNRSMILKDSSLKKQT